MAIEAKRGCGYRKVGGIYLVGERLAEPCHRLPYLLDVCPTCHGGVKQSRGWTWVDGEKLFSPPCSRTQNMKSRIDHCALCAVCLCHPLEKAGLLWVGERFYPTPQHFTLEASKLGVSRRIAAVPRHFILGVSWVLLAHAKAATRGDELAPGIFSVFRPKRIELIVKQSDATPERIAEMQKKGITPVVVPDNDRDHQGNVYDEEVTV